VKLALSKTGLLLVVASIMVLSVLLLAACSPSQEPPFVQQESSLLSTGAPVEATDEVAELIETGNTKEAVSVEAFVAAAEELSFETLRPVDMEYLRGASYEQMRWAEEADLVKIAGVGYRGVTEAIFFDWNFSGEAEADFASMRNLFVNQSGRETKVRLNISGLNYDKLSADILDGFFITVRAEDTMIIVQGVPEGMGAALSLLEAIGYQ